MLLYWLMRQACMNWVSKQIVMRNLSQDWWDQKQYVFKLLAHLTYQRQALLTYHEAGILGGQILPGVLQLGVQCLSDTIQTVWYVVQVVTLFCVRPGSARLILGLFISCPKMEKKEAAKYWSSTYLETKYSYRTRRSNNTPNLPVAYKINVHL